MEEGKSSMSCRFSSGLIVKRCFDGIKDLVKIVNLEVDHTGWTIKAYDESRTASLRMYLNLTAFEKYECGKTMKLGIHVAHMNKILRLCDNVDALIVHYSEDSDFVIVRVEKEAAARVVEFELKLMEYADDEFPAHEELSEDFVELPAAEYAKITKDLQTFGNDLEILATPTSVSFKAHGEFGAGNVNLKSGDAGVDGVSINLSNTFTQVFPLRFAASFARAANCNSLATLHFSEPPKPLVVRFPLDDKMKPEKDEGDNTARTRLTAKYAGMLQFHMCAKN